MSYRLAVELWPFEFLDRLADLVQLKGSRAPRPRLYSE
jgi:hypothetical protein